VQVAAAGCGARVGQLSAVTGRTRLSRAHHPSSSFVGFFRSKKEKTKILCGLFLGQRFLRERTWELGGTEALRT